MTHLTDLPYELLLKIVSGLSFQTLVNLDKAFPNAPLSQQAWNDSLLWKPIFARHFPDAVPMLALKEDTHWRKAFIATREEEYQRLSPRHRRLFFLMKEGYSSAFKRQNPEHPDMLVKDSNGETLIHWALRRGNQAILDEIYQRLCQRYISTDHPLVNVTKTDSAGRSILYWAIYYRQKIDTIKELIERDALDVYQDDNGERLLLLAANFNHIEAVLHLLDEEEMDPNALRSRDGLSSIFIAADKGFTAIVRILLKRGANPNVARRDNGATPVYIAAAKGHVEIVEALLKKGAKPAGAPTQNGTTPLSLAAQFGHLEIVRALLNKGANPNAAGHKPLLIAIAHDHLEIVDALLNKSVHPDNVKTSDGNTALHFAAHTGHHRIVKCLLDHGANPDACTNSGITPLFIAAQFGHLEVAVLLLQHRADSRLARTETTTALTTIASRVNPATEHRMKLFISEQDQPGGTTTITITPWQIACIMDKKSIIDCFLLHDIAPGKPAKTLCHDTSPTFFAPHSADQAFLDLCFRGVKDRREQEGRQLAPAGSSMG